MNGGRKGNSVAIKAPSRSRIKAIKVICDRCQQIVEGIRGEQFTSGFYDMTKWEEYRREGRQDGRESCMRAGPKYVELYGSCFGLAKVRLSCAVPCTLFAPWSLTY